MDKDTILRKCKHCCHYVPGNEHDCYIPSCKKRGLFGTYLHKLDEEQTASTCTYFKPHPFLDTQKIHDEKE